MQDGYCVESVGVTPCHGYTSPTQMLVLGISPQPESSAKSLVTRTASKLIGNGSAATMKHTDVIARKVGDDPEAVERGHFFWDLDGKRTTDDQAVMTPEYLNGDNSSNQQNSISQFLASIDRILMANLKHVNAVPSLASM